ncbi:MAG: glycosyltransferase [Thiohalocapsa sp.]|jgi:glycosyltransferase involved in cell wall biosynthesis|uniref:glycosyltransferase n=1 Tax=Thiohalocapsa sp. TaxID=2497641 RepID=UPI0025DC2D32|nr:glycosyltransferase [Thiohalocapsa sp.]MCG6942430.1 glycosyltransferase [Thiohalocapsa sp.]
MKILHVEGGAELYGGAKQVLYLLEGLAAQGIENHLACRSGCDLARQAAPFAAVHGMAMRGDLDFGLIGRLGRLMDACSPDLVHLHSRIGADVMGGIAARRRGLPVVHTRRVDNPEPRWLVAWKYRLHDRVVAISEGIARVLRAEGLPEHKLRVVRSAVAASRYDGPRDPMHCRDELDLAADTPAIGVIAQLIERKGHQVLLDALPRLLAVHPRLAVFFFGKGPLAGALQEQIDDRGLAARVRLMGFREDLAGLLSCLDIVVHPALMEGLGVSLLQAAAAGVPIVASAVGGIPEAVQDGVNGRLVPPGDPARLAAAVHELLRDPALRTRLGAGGRRLVRESFSVEGMVNGNLAVYRELL